MTSTLQKILVSAKLISLPEIYLKLKGLIDDPESTMAEVALLVGRDPGMSVRFLRLVNSPLNRRSNKIETVAHAVSLLGSQQVHDIVLSASIAKAFDGMLSDVMNMKQFWQRSIYCAVTARQLARQCDEMETERLFVIGLLHDIGHLFMYLEVPEQAQAAILKARDEQRPLYQVERDLLGFDYAYLAGQVMKDWDLPKSIQVPVTCHPEPSQANHFVEEAALLHLASLLVQADLDTGVFGEGPYAVNPAAWSATGLTLEQCLNVQKAAADQYLEVSKSILG